MDANMRITKIEAQKRRPERKSIFVDGKFLAGVSDETLLRTGLRTGDAIDPTTIQSLQQTEGLLSAKNAALRFLSVRPRTVREIRDKLRQKEFTDSETSNTIEELKRTGLLDDDAFARMYIRNAMQVRPIGKVLLKRKMLLLGVDLRTIEAALADTLPEYDQSQVARASAEKFLTRGSQTRRKPDAVKDRKRVGSYLARRGFTWDVIEPILKELVPMNRNIE